MWKFVETVIIAYVGRSLEMTVAVQLVVATLIRLVFYDEKDGAFVKNEELTTTNNLYFLLLMSLNVRDGPEFVPA
jgi:hypothetical protein